MSSQTTNRDVAIVGALAALSVGGIAAALVKKRRDDARRPVVRDVATAWSIGTRFGESAIGPAVVRTANRRYSVSVHRNCDGNLVHSGEAVPIKAASNNTTVLFITAAHVIAPGEDFTLAALVGPDAKAVYETVPASSVIAYNPSKDFALFVAPYSVLALAECRVPTPTFFGVIPGSVISVAGPAYYLHGDGMAYSVAFGAVVGQASGDPERRPGEIRYLLSTRAGASGAPLFSGSNLIGIHQGSVVINNDGDRQGYGLGGGGFMSLINAFYDPAAKITKRIGNLPDVVDAATGEDAYGQRTRESVVLGTGGWTMDDIHELLQDTRFARLVEYVDPSEYSADLRDEWADFEDLVSDYQRIGMGEQDAIDVLVGMNPHLGPIGKLMRAVKGARRRRNKGKRQRQTAVPPSIQEEGVKEAWPVAEKALYPAVPEPSAPPVLVPPTGGVVGQRRLESPLVEVGQVPGYNKALQKRSKEPMVPPDKLSEICTDLGIDTGVHRAFPHRSFKSLYGALEDWAGVPDRLVVNQSLRHRLAEWSFDRLCRYKASADWDHHLSEAFISLRDESASGIDGFADFGAWASSPTVSQDIKRAREALEELGRRAYLLEQEFEATTVHPLVEYLVEHRILWRPMAKNEPGKIVATRDGSQPRVRAIMYLSAEFRFFERALAGPLLSTFKKPVSERGDDDPIMIGLSRDDSGLGDLREVVRRKLAVRDPEGGGFLLPLDLSGADATFPGGVISSLIEGILDYTGSEAQTQPLWARGLQVLHSMPYVLGLSGSAYQAAYFGGMLSGSAFTSVGHSALYATLWCGDVEPLLVQGDDQILFCPRGTDVGRVLAGYKTAGFRPRAGEPVPAGPFLAGSFEGLPPLDFCSVDLITFRPLNAWKVITVATCKPYTAGLEIALRHELRNLPGGADVLDRLIAGLRGAGWQ